MIGVYKIINPKGKIYIGQSVNIQERKLQYIHLSKYSIGRKLFNSIQKYGWENHKFEIIEECKIEELDEKEIFWGIKFNTLNGNGLNLKLGNGGGLCSEETKKKMSESHKLRMTKDMKNQISKSLLGKKKSDNHKQNMRKPKLSKLNYKNNGKWVSRQRIILQYDLEGNFIKEWEYIKEAEIFYHPNKLHKNNICNCCRGSQKTAYGYVWKYK